MKLEEKTYEKSKPPGKRSQPGSNGNNDCEKKKIQCLKLMKISSKVYKWNEKTCTCDADSSKSSAHVINKCIMNDGKWNQKCQCCNTKEMIKNKETCC